MEDLQPPRKSVELEDAGAHELESSDENDHFSDASEGREPISKESGSEDHSSIPITRVERVDSQPGYGEVPGTEAYKRRVTDAVPDEVEVVPEGLRSRSSSRVGGRERSHTIGGTPIPRTVVEKVDPDAPSYGEVPGTSAYHLHLADAQPDEIHRAPPQATSPIAGLPTLSHDRSEISSVSREDEHQGSSMSATQDDGGGGSGVDDEDHQESGDDFDDFESGEDEDFGDFGEEIGEQLPQPSLTDQPQIHASVDAPPPHYKPFDFMKFTSAEQLQGALQPHILEIFSESPNANRRDPLGEANPMLMSERSQSLWSQLVAPPPLQPPNWVRSRIRRLFLVSLGVPVDLDEILPASKQKKLILPSINIPGDRSPRVSSDERGIGAISRLKKNNDSSASVTSTASKSERRRRGPPPPPALDVNRANLLCSTTDAALGNFTDEELKVHVQSLQVFIERAKEVREYWEKRKESAIGNKEAFEGVIENLVKHAKKVRK
ncbi:hypothetical protein P152DRAFT_469026 [Eremomyces bilateralis CBS 781.70]|uniref:Uncharacterized protein n=1 Tax=Eremomyces bilateralis CBS 781.70 TaxID=1392243 RepID=A0A6G1FRI0_9PEZI|nr:uncharacterized protein P152DRAFT_469026 [Eremomyces bilateralis CBS 781.70]KAF1808338.1 hypothetical protein P152DRAFT_469026 [Eremomyces bilateralis CBS 781.70]